jgi:O-antigen/teichoic acid export membrane protein
VWRPASDVALYNVAHRTAFLTTLMLTSVNSIAAPKFAELYHTRDLEALGATARDSARMMVVLALPVLLTFVFVPGFVMGLFGPEFEVGASVLVILALGQFVNVSTGSVGFVLIMTSGWPATTRRLRRA